MKITIKAFGFIALVAVIVFSMAACGGGGGEKEPPPQFDVTFNANGGKFAGDGTTQVIKVYQGETVTPPWATNGDLMVFGWNTQADGEGTVFDKKEPVTASLTVYAQWAKPENLPDKNRWDISRDPSSSATLDNYSYEVDDDGLCTVKVTVGGKPETEADRTWTINAYYHYTGVADKCYEYTFEAWTESGTRDLKVQYYCDNDNRVYLEEHRFPKTTPTSYTIYGGALPKGGLQAINFHLAGQTGTVYIKMIKIKEHPRIILTITGIGSDYGHWLNKAELLDNDWNTVAVSPDIFIGNDGTAMLYFWDVEDDVEDREKPWNIAGDYLILIWFWGKDNDNAWSIYLTEELYTFAENGHYTINFNRFKKL